MNEVPSFEFAKRFIVNRPGEEEVVRQSLYDFQTYPNAGFTSKRYFQVPVGQSSKTVQDTNMDLAGQLPQPIFHLTQSIELLFFPGVNPVTVVNNSADFDVTAPNFANDVYSVMKAGSLTLHIGSKDYLEEAPLGRFPPKTRLEAHFAAAVAYTQATAANGSQEAYADYASASGRPYFLDPPILIPPTQNFDLEIEFSSAVSLPSGVDGRLGIVLDGLLYRQSQ